MALLASYMLKKENGESLETYLANRVFAGNVGSVVKPDPKDVKGFEIFTECYKQGLGIELAAEKLL